MMSDPVAQSAQAAKPERWRPRRLARRRPAAEDLAKNVQIVSAPQVERWRPAG
jgi:hypothetical protein